jgi:hypothetical protein
VDRRRAGVDRELPCRSGLELRGLTYPYVDEVPPSSTGFERRPDGCTVTEQVTEALKAG